MKLILVLLIFIPSFLNATTIEWGSYAIFFKGPRAHVLKMTSSLSVINRTDSGEKLINHISQTKPKFEISIDDQWSFNIKEPHLIKIDFDVTNLEENIYSIFQEIFEENSFSDEVNLDRFLQELQDEKQIDLTYDDYPFITIRSSYKKNEFND